MEWTIEFIENGNYLRVISKGVFNADDHLRMLEEVISIPLWKPGMKILFDSRQVSHSESDFYIIKEASINAARYDSQIGLGRGVLLTNEEDFEKGLEFRTYIKEAINARMEVFQDEEAAIEWLNQPLESAPDEEI